MSNKPTDTRESIQKTLMRGRWYRALPAELRDRLLQVGVIRRFAPGEMVFRIGEQPFGLMGLVSGSLLVSRPESDDARPLQVGLVSAPMWTGEISASDRLPISNDGTALTPLTILHVPQMEVERLGEDNPAWWRHVAELQSARIRAVLKAVADQFPQSASVRIARRLFGEYHGQGMLAPGHTNDRIDLSQERLGQLLSLSRQTVSQELRRLEANGWIRCHYGMIEIIDPDALRTVGQETPTD